MTSEKICANHIVYCAVIFCVHFRKTTTDILYIMQDIYDEQRLTNAAVFCSLPLSLTHTHIHTHKLVLRQAIHS